ncbi:hypothetical protein L1987_33891 [Smallanthus sonchifolius]|uniref:Uncharacterized protein n=1 Tax=Smallanthus sonchifolius TaxID=185202 RepID=A0ACB9HS34_9ASTR|nr:hypothetical protein L1987_33891 [Smallanthus sonchifolius]
MHTYDISHRLFMISLAAMLTLVEALPIAAAQSIRGSSPAYPYEIGGNVSSSVKIIIVALIFGMFLIVFVSLYIRNCLDNSPIETRMSLPVVNNQRSRLKFPCGLDRNVIESLPVFLYSDVKKLKIGNGGLECAVCISEFADDERLRFLPKCHHVFHPECIDAWLASHTTCPVCRADVTVTNIDTDSESHHELTHSQIDESGTEIGAQNQNSIQVEEERADPKFPRSHSTGHSLVSPGENCERYTLRLPEEVRKQIVTLKRAKSCGCGVDGNSRRGLRGGADGSKGGRRWNADRLCGRSDLWNFTVTRMPGFTVKTGSTSKSEPAQSSSSAGLPV